MTDLERVAAILTTHHRELEIDSSRGAPDSALPRTVVWHLRRWDGEASVRVESTTGNLPLMIATSGERGIELDSIDGAVAELERRLGLRDEQRPAESLASPAVCVARMAAGERLPATLSALLLPIDPASLHVYRLAAKTEVELHYHDFDEYWAFIEGRPRVTLRTPQGLQQVFELGPGDVVACLRGVEHTLWADHELVYYQYSSIRQGGERDGHLTRG